MKKTCAGANNALAGKPPVPPGALGRSLPACGGAEPGTVIGIPRIPEISITFPELPVSLPSIKSQILGENTLQVGQFSG